MCEFFAGLERTKHTVIRHSNTYGPYDKYDLEKLVDKNTDLNI